MSGENPVGNSLNFPPGGSMCLVATNTAKTINLPTPDTGRVVHIVDSTGGANQFPITILPTGADVTIRNGYNTIVQPFGTLSFLANNNNWYAIVNESGIDNLRTLNTSNINASNISAVIISTSFGFFSTISTGSVFGKHIGDGSLLTAIPNTGAVLAVSNLVTTNTTNITTISNLVNSVSTNVTTVSTNLNTLSNNVTTVSNTAGTNATNITTISNRINYLLTVSNYSAITMSTSFGFFSTISTGSIYGRHIGDGSLLTGLPAGGLTILPPIMSTTVMSSGIITGNLVSSARLSTTFGYISSLTVDSLSFGVGNGFINMGDVITTSLSSIQIFTSSLLTTNLQVGIASTLSYIAFPGLQLGYNQTVIAEQSIGTGLQELLLFKGSTNTDRIRMQTTGTIVFEPGVSARVFPSASSNATPAMIITTGSNVGIGILAPTVALDVAGTGRFQMLSTQQIYVSSISSGSIYGRHIGDGSQLTGLPAAGLTSLPPILSTNFLSTGFLSASNISAFTMSTNFGFFSTISAGSIYSRFIGDGSLLTAIPNTGAVLAVSNLVNTNTTSITTISNLLNSVSTNVTTVSTNLNTLSNNVTTISNTGATNATNITTVSNTVGTNTTNITTISNLLNAVSTNVTTVSTNLNTLSNNVTTISNTGATNATNITTVSNTAGTNATNITTISNLLNSVSTNVTNVSTNLNTLSNNVTTISNTGATNTTNITTVSNTAGTNATNITTISNLLNSVSTNVTNVSTNLNTLSNNVTTISNTGATNATNITTVSNTVGTNTTNITTISNLLNSVSTNVTTVSTNLNTLSNNVTTVSNTGATNATNITTVSNSVNYLLGVSNYSAITMSTSSGFFSTISTGTVFGRHIGDASLLTNVPFSVPAVLSTNTLSTGFLSASNISAISMSTNFGFFSTISTGTVFGRHIGDGSGLTGIAATSTFTSLTVTSGAGTINFTGGSNTSAYGTGVDTLSLKSQLTAYGGGIASLFFGNATAGYPLARIYGIDSAGSAPGASALVFQTAVSSLNASLSGINIFSYTGADQSYTVPSGVTSVTISMWGAGGAGGAAGGYGGGGAYVNGTLAVTAGMSLRIIVGQGGSVGATTSYGGGGAASGAASGGGRSAIQLIQTGIVTGASASAGTITYTTSVAHGLQAGQGFIVSNLASGSVFNLTGIVASVLSTTSFTLTNATTGTTVTGGTGTLTIELVDVGGGGGGPNCGGGAFSGNAGLVTGQSGSAETIVTGGTQTAAGSGGGGSAGTQFQAGAPGNGNGGYAGGGGGGFFPGGSGGGTSRAAGGGSSYITYSGLTVANSANGNAATAIGTGDTYYVAGISVGAPSGGGTGGNGRVVIAAAPSFVMTEAMRISSNAFVGIGMSNPSTMLDVAGSIRGSNLQIGTVSSLSFLAFPGLQRQYSQTALAEVSTGTGLQEMLLFRGSTATDRIRMQTTGSIIFETGVSARVFPAAPSNATPAMVINTSSNVGIGIAAPTVTLDVAGAGRFQTLSTQQIYTSSVIAGVVSSATVYATTVSSMAGFFSTVNNYQIGGALYLPTQIFTF